MSSKKVTASAWIFPAAISRALIATPTRAGRLRPKRKRPSRRRYTASTTTAFPPPPWSPPSLSATDAETRVAPRTTRRNPATTSWLFATFDDAKGEASASLGIYNVLWKQCSVSMSPSQDRRDKSAPTDGRMILLISIIGPHTAFTLVGQQRIHTPD